MFFIQFNCIKQVEGDKQPPEKRRRLNINDNSNNLSSPSINPLVYNYESEEDENDHEENLQNYSIEDQSAEGYIAQPIKPEISKVVEPLKRKIPLSNYWVNFPGASSSALADVKITISDKVIALWKGHNTDNTLIEITIEDSDLHEFGKFLSSKLSFHHPLISEPKNKMVMDIKKKLLLNARIIMGNLIANANNQVQHHKDFLFDFDKNYIRPIQLQQQSIISMVREIRAYLLPRSLDKLIKSKIISAPLLSTSIWNIPPECEKALEEANRKRNQFFRGRRPNFRFSLRGQRFSRGSFRGSRPLTKKASSSKLTSK